jgi:hypothetical protein
VAAAVGLTDVAAVGGSIDASVDDPEVVDHGPTLSLPADKANHSDSLNLIVRIEDEEELALLDGLDPDQVAWLEVPLALAHRDELNPFPVDVLLQEPGEQAADLYSLAGLREPNLPRLSIPTKPGFADAATIGMGLHFPIRLIPLQPAAEEVSGLGQVLERYLHDANVSQAVEPFYSALTTLLQGENRTLWDAVEYDPSYYRCDPPRPKLEKDDAVATHLQNLIEEEAECATCPLQSWCAGWFKWPEPDYDCQHVRRLFDTVEQAATQMQADLSQAMEVNP